MEIFVGGMGIPDLKLNGLSFLDDVADDDGAGLLIGSEQVADQKIPSGELRALFIHRDTDMQCPLCLGAFIAAELSEHRLQTMQGGDSAEFLNYVVLRLRDDEAVADRATALRNDGANRDVAGQGDPDQSVGVHVIVEEQAILAEILTTPGQSTQCTGAGVVLLEDGQYVLHGCGEGIGKEHHNGGGVSDVVHLRPITQRELIMDARTRKPQRMGDHSRQMCCPESGCRSRFDFPSCGDDSLACAADQGGWGQYSTDGRCEGLGLVGMLGRNEEESHVNSRRAQLFAYGSDQFIGGSLRVTLAGQSGGKSQRRWRGNNHGGWFCKLGRPGVSAWSDARIHTFRSIRGEFLIIAPHIGMIIIKLREQVVEFGWILGFQCLHYSRL